MHRIRGLFLLRFLLLIWLGLAHRLASAQSMSCPLITSDDLGSTMDFSDTGLVARAIVPPGEASLNVPVRIMNFMIVCDASGNQINTSSFVSVVVEFQCDITSAISSLAVCDRSTIVTRQYQFQCIEQNGQLVWGTTVSGSNIYVQTLNPTATLSTPLTNQCRRCIDDQQSSRADPTTHCDPCLAPCNSMGQGRCLLGQIEDVCCSFYLQNSCTNLTECPSGLVNDSNSVCVCPALTLANGVVSYSDMGSGVERDIGSVATYTCNSGFRLEVNDTQAVGNTRTCNTRGWSDQDFMCVCPSLSLDNGYVSYLPANRDIGSVATYKCNPGYRLTSSLDGMTRTCNESGWSDQTFTCELIQCPDLGDTIENGKVLITPTARTVNSTAEYSCDGGYKLDKGDAKRTCQAGGTWSGEEPECSKSGLSTGAIIGIAVGAAVGGILIIVLTIIIVIVVVKKCRD